jgi:hypothetical protein
MPAVHFVRSSGHNESHLQPFQSEIDAECWNVLYNKEIRCISRGTLLKPFLALRLHIEIFTNGVCKLVTKLSDEKYLRYLALYVILAATEMSYVPNFKINRNSFPVYLGFLSF